MQSQQLALDVHDVPTVRRIIVTGSRNFHPDRLIRDIVTGLHRAHPTATLVHGACRGPDTVAADTWEGLGGITEPWPAQWHIQGRRAGPTRNGKMVRAGADMGVAFWDEYSPGTRNCIMLMRKAHIPVTIYTCQRTYTTRPPGLRP